jgi:hypothetical protein
MLQQYDAWLAHVFDHAVDEPAWYFGIDETEFQADAQTVTELITATMLRSGTDLLAYSDGQVAQGLHYMFNNSTSNVVFAILDGNAPFEGKLDALHSIKTLYRDCFTPRCAPVLSHLDELGANPLNGICYMLWDITPLAYWGTRERREEAYAAVLDILSFALNSTNPACVESALHGLGHLDSTMRQQAQQIVQTFLSKPHIQNEQLLRYTQQAFTGYIL